MKCLNLVFLTMAILIAAALPHLAFAQVAGCDGSGNCYIRAGATGAATGADWDNAYTNIGTGTGQAHPGSLIRGVTYYVAAGTYGSAVELQFNTPLSGTLLITIQAATIANHGTATGWSNSFQGQAVFTPTATMKNYFWDFETGFYTINGAYNDCGTYLTEPFLPCRTGYGFKFNNNNGSNKPNAPVSIVTSNLLTTAIPGTPANNMTIEFIEFQGSSDATGSATVQGSCDGAISIDSENSSAGPNVATNEVIAYNYIHDTAGGPMYVTGANGVLIDHNWMLRDWGFNDSSNDTSCHSELGIRPSNQNGVTNVTISNNYLENLASTATIATPASCSGACGANTGMTITGNTFFCNSAEAAFVPSGIVMPTCPGGDGFIFLFNGPFTNVNINDNTFDGSFGGADGGIDVGDGTAVTVSGLNIQNNIWSHQEKLSGLRSCTSPAVCTNVVWNFTSYFNGSTKPAGDTDPNAQVSAKNPFINASTNTANANNYGLAVNTAAWTPLAAPYNIDSIGGARTSSRGAFQMGGVVADVPAPPTSLIVTIQQ
jgi:hypothetical protein